MRIIHDTSTGEQEIPPEALAQAFEDFMLARFYVDPENKFREVQARNLRNHFWKFLTEPIRLRSEVEAQEGFIDFTKQDLIRMHSDLAYLEVFSMKNDRRTGEKNQDLREAIAEVSEAIEGFVQQM